MGEPETDESESKLERLAPASPMLVMFFFGMLFLIVCCAWQLASDFSGKATWPSCRIAFAGILMFVGAYDVEYQFKPHRRLVALAVLLFGTWGIWRDVPVLAPYFPFLPAAWLMVGSLFYWTSDPPKGLTGEELSDFEESRFFSGLALLVIGYLARYLFVK